MTVANKSLNQTAQDKIVPYKNDSDQKNRNQTVENKKMAPYKNDCGEKNEPQCKIKKSIYKMTVAKKRSQTIETNSTL